MPPAHLIIVGRKERDTVSAQTPPWALQPLQLETQSEPQAAPEK